MVVIGLLIAAVMKGKDVIKGAEVKQINQEFLNKWVNVADGYADKTGLHLNGNWASDDNVSGANGLLTAAGIDHPATSREVSGEEITSTIKTTFQNAPVDSDNRTRNLVVFVNVPGDIAIAYDKMVDGEYDGDAGKCRIVKAQTAADDTIGTDGKFVSTAYTGNISGTDVTDSKTMYTVAVVLDH
jgi:hypothetical protein